MTTRYTRIFARRFETIKGNRSLDVCVCCGTGIRRVWHMSNGWTFGPQCKIAATTDARKTGASFLTTEAFERIATRLAHYQQGTMT